MSSWLIAAGALVTVGLALGTLLIERVHLRQILRTTTLLMLTFTLGVFVRANAEPDGKAVLAAAAYDGVFEGTVFSPEETARGVKTRIVIHAPSQFRGISVIAYLSDTSYSLLPRDTIRFQGGVELIPGPQNPFVFDVAKYYRNQGIHLRAFPGKDQIVEYRPFSGISIKRQSAVVRNALSSIIDTYISAPGSNSVLHAMTIGVRNGLDEDLYEAYARSGAIHILAISGLHVGIVSFLLYLIVGKVRPSTSLQRKLIKAVVLLGGIWTFAFIAGMSPSIMRAALMFSLYLGGLLLRRPAPGLNILACTAFLCLAIDPFQINSLSFQFSYLALGGILIFYKPLNRLCFPKTRLGKLAWGTVVMSVAAQLFLLPFMIYYFQQISVISLLSGFIAIPGAYGSLCGGILLFVLHFLSTDLAGWWGILVEWLIDMLNTAMVWMSEIPGSYIAQIYIPGILVAALCAITCCLALYVVTRSVKWLYITISLAVVFTAMESIDVCRAYGRKMLAIYAGKEEIGLDYVAGRTCFTSRKAPALSTFRAKEINAFRNQARVKAFRLVDWLMPEGDLLLVSIPEEQPGQDTCLLIVVISHFDPYTTDEEILSLKPDWIVLSHHLKRNERQSARSFCLSHHMQVHDLREQGTFYLTKDQTRKLYASTWQNITG